MAKTPAERQRKRRERLKNDGIITYSCEIHECDKSKIDEFIKKLRLKRKLNFDIHKVGSIETPHE